jgi:hypothetical protein
VTVASVAVDVYAPRTEVPTAVLLVGHNVSPALIARGYRYLY